MVMIPQIFKLKQCKILVVLCMLSIPVLLYVTEFGTGTSIVSGIDLQPVSFVKRIDGARRNISLQNYEWMEQNCLGATNDTLPSMETLVDILGKWANSTDSECLFYYRVFSRIFAVERDETDVVIGATFARKVREWLKSDDLVEKVHHQTLLSVYNKYTNEQNLFNPLREKRPIVKPEQSERQYVEKMSAESARSCDFCNYKNSTAEDIFGRIESTHSFTAANTFKVNKWHSMAILKSHHPLNWTEEEFLDVMDTAQKWFTKVHSIDPSYVYPMIEWDLLRHAGASQVHPHIHLLLAKSSYHGGFENWKRAGERYNFEHSGENFFVDLVTMHDLLGLATRLNSAVVFANLVPKKDNEFVIIGSEPNKDFFKLLFLTLREYIDGMDKLCFSLGIALTNLDPLTKNNVKVPTFARIVSRGAVAEVRSDIGVFDLFGSTNVNNDPFKLIQKMRKRIDNI